MRYPISVVFAAVLTLPGIFTPGAAAAALSLPNGVVDNMKIDSRADLKSTKFDLKAPSHDLFRHVHLRDDTVQQGFAFDQKNRRLFVSQRRDGTPLEAGHLCITQVDFSGKYLGHMYLNGFGHGVAFAAEAVGGNTYLWTEVDSRSNGYGQRLARFKWTNGKTISSSSSGLKKFSPVKGSTGITCVINLVDNTLVARYTLSGSKHISAWPLANAVRGDFAKPVVSFKYPTMGGRSSVFQGYTAFGQYLYVLTGTAYEINGGIVNSEVASIDMKTGKVHQKPVLTNAGKTLSFREPEGMAVYTTAAGEPRLFLGFASGTAGDRRSNLFYKNKLS